jgi:hypothetical protein
MMLRLMALLIVALAQAAAQVYTSSPAPVKGQSSSTTGAAVPTTADLTGVVSSGNLTGLIGCDSSALLSMSTATTTQAIALQAGKSIYVCGFVLNGGGTTTARIVQGTGTNCGTGQANMTPAFNLAAGGNVTVGNGVGVVLKTTAANALCITNSAAIALNILVIYTVF